MNISGAALHVAPSAADVLLSKIHAHTAKVGVVGIGYVGLPLAVEKAKVGFVVRGYDRNPIRVDQVNHGLNYIRDVADADLADVVDSGRLSASIDFSSLHECDVIVICVPTPLTSNKDPDISYIKHVGKEISERLRVGQLICLESTTYPGTTEEVLLPLLEQSGLKVERDFFLAFSPERVDPGNKRYTTRNTNKVVGGVTPSCLEVAAAFYGETIINVLRLSSPRVAEMTKVFENTFRAVNIAMVNEMAILCDKLDINIWEVVDAASTKPFGMIRFDPGPGVGGHCIPLDPFYLAWRAREVDSPTRFIELAGEVNLSMPYFVRLKVTKALNRVSRAVKNAKILVIGVAYKRDIADARESPALKVIELLDGDGAHVSYHDPFVGRIEDPLTGRQRHSVFLTDEALGEADCVVILTDHSQIDWSFVVKHAKHIVDTRNATRDVASRPNVTLL
jgi:UDP-N-acetyl-D-glucosamine dehydrogenase